MVGWIAIKQSFCSDLSFYQIVRQQALVGDFRFSTMDLLVAGIAVPHILIGHVI